MYGHKIKSDVNKMNEEKARNINMKLNIDYVHSSDNMVSNVSCKKT